MKQFSLALLAVAAALAISPSASADSFTFTLSGGLNTASGILTGTLIAPGEWNITGAIGFDINGQAATVVANPTPGSLNTSLGFVNFDDLLMPPPGAPSVTNGGLLFLLADGDYVNIWSVGDQLYIDTYDPATGWLNNGLNGDPISDSITPAPEPSSLLLLGTGLAGLAFLAFRKRKRSRLVLRAEAA